MNYRTTMGMVAATIVLVVAGTFVGLANRPPTGDCSAELRADDVSRIRATKVVVRPWLGEHHVYGVFLVPKHYYNTGNYVAILTVRGLDRHFPAGGDAVTKHVDDIVADSQHYVLRSYLHTRVALWFLANGLFGDLQRPCNWTVMFIDRHQIRRN